MLPPNTVPAPSLDFRTKTRLELLHPFRLMILKLELKLDLAHEYLILPRIRNTLNGTCTDTKTSIIDYLPSILDDRSHPCLPSIEFPLVGLPIVFPAIAMVSLFLHVQKNKIV